MPETIENVETTEQVEVQDAANGCEWIVPMLFGALAYAAGSHLIKVARKGIAQLKEKKEQKLTVVDGGKSQDNSGNNTEEVKDKNN